MKVGLLFFRQQLREGQAAPRRSLRLWDHCPPQRDALGLPGPLVAPCLGRLVAKGMNLGQEGMLSPKSPSLRQRKRSQKQRSSLLPLPLPLLKTLPPPCRAGEGKKRRGLLLTSNCCKPQTKLAILS